MARRSQVSAAKEYTVGISDGMYWNAGGETLITADSVAEAQAEAQDWADAGDYPCRPPVVVTLVMRDTSGEIARWSHRIPDEACSGEVSR